MPTRITRRLSRAVQCPPRAFRRAMRPYLALALAVLLSYALFYAVLGVNQTAIRVCMAAGVVLCGLYALLDIRSADRVTLALIAAGAVMRIGYMLYTPYSMRAHDVASLADSGHLSYIYGLFAGAGLPRTNRYEFYQPPLQHIAEAAVARAFSLIQPKASAERLFEACKTVPCFASCALLPVSRRLCEELRLGKRAAVAAVAVVAFHPAFYLLSSSINNDALALLFFMLSILYTVRWYRRPAMKRAALLALCIGLSMMAKLSGAAAAFFTGPVFLAMLLKTAREKRAGAVLAQFAVFLGICVPLALWYPVRNLILFHQPLGYVFQPDPHSPLYCGGRSIAERFLSFPPGQVLSPVFCRPDMDCNLWIYTLKCSVFGEYSFTGPLYLAYALVLSNLALILLSLAAMVHTLLRRRDADPFARYGLPAVWLVQMVSFVAFNVGFPYGCTMDFRYIMPTAIVGAVCIGMFLDRPGAKRTPAARLLLCLCAAAAGLFAASSVVFYIQ